MKSQWSKSLERSTRTHLARYPLTIKKYYSNITLLIKDVTDVYAHKLALDASSPELGELASQARKAFQGKLGIELPE